MTLSDDVVRTQPTLDTVVQVPTFRSMVRRGTRPAGEDSNDHQLAVRVPVELIQALDDEVERLRLERPGAKVQRSDAVREILYQALIADASYAESAARRRIEQRGDKNKTSG